MQEDKDHDIKKHNDFNDSTPIWEDQCIMLLNAYIPCVQNLGNILCS